MAAAPEFAYIYVMGLEEGPCKIGHFLAPARPLRQIQTTQKGFVVTVGKWPVGIRIALAVERYVHWLLRDKHFRSEWFDVAREEACAAIIVALAAQDRLDSCNPIPPLDPRGRSPKPRFAPF